jgi:excisionase family DNA binding protein
VFVPTKSLTKPRILHANNVAKRIGVTERTVRHMAAHGRIPAFKSGRRAWSFYAADIDAHIAMRVPAREL